MGVIRLILAISVVLAHAGSIFGISIVGGPIAVETFYIISGFYMSLILNEKYIGKNGSYRLFLSNRLLRLLPIYWFILLLTIIVSLSFAYRSHGEFWSKLQPYIDYRGKMSFISLFYLIFANLFLLGQDIVMFLGLNLNTGNLFFTSNFWNTTPRLYTFLLVPQAWTIGVEITFYLIAPFLVRRKPAIVLMLIGLSLTLRILLIKNGLSNDPWNYRFFPNELMFFLLGNLGYRIFKRIEKLEIDKGYLLFITGSIISFTFFFNNLSFLHKTSLFFIAFFLSLPFVFKLSKSNKVDQIIGDLSYPVYLSHMFILIFIEKFELVVRHIGKGLTVVILTILFSWFINKIIAKPLERVRQRRLSI